MTKNDHDQDDLKWDPLRDFARLSDAFEGKTFYVSGEGTNKPIEINPFEIEPPSEDSRHQLTLGAPSRSRTWEKMSVIKHGYAAYEASPEKFPSGYITDIQDDIIRIHFGRITDDEELIEILVGVQTSDVERLLDQPAVELVEDDSE